MTESMAKPKARRASRASGARKPAAKATKTANAGTKAKGPAKAVKLLSGGNPQIAKAYGDAPVQAYVAAMPGWKSDVGRRLDALIVRTAESSKAASTSPAAARAAQPGSGCSAAGCAAFPDVPG